MSRKFQRFILLLLVVLLVVPQSWITPVVEAETNEDIPVFLYHRIVDNPSNEWTDTSIETFGQTMKYLHDNGYHTLSAEQYVSIMEGKETAPENPILLTFDDATPDFIENALPILEQYDMNAVLFVVSDWIDGDYSMSEDELESLVDKENVSLQNHSKDHDAEIWGSDGSKRSEITKEQAEEQISQANEYLKSITGNDPVLMAYPYGSYNDAAKEVNQENGIKYAFKVGYPDGDAYAMGRHYVTDQNLTQIAEMIGGPAPDSELAPESITYDFEDEADLADWVKRGNPTLELTEEEAQTGSKSLKVSNRDAGYAGPALVLNDKLESGATYEITAYAKRTETTAGQTIVMGEDPTYSWLGNASVEHTEWVELKTTDYSIAADAGETKLYFEIYNGDQNNTEDFYIDKVVITMTSPASGEGDEPEEERDPALEFTTVTFEDQTTGGFEGRAGTETLTVTDETNHTEAGSYALKVEDRSNTWHGPALRVEKYVDKGHEYKISAWVKLISPESSQIQLSTQVGEGDGASYNNLQGKTISTEDGWIQLEGIYRYSSVGDEFLTIYVESSNNSTASFYIDDISFEPTGSGTVEVQEDLTPIKDVYEDYFLIGNAVSAKEFEGNRLELLNLHHNLVTAENAMKPGYAFNDQREFDFTAEDALVEKALAEGLKIHGHVLVWHQQSADWQHSDENGDPLSREEALTNLRTHVKTAVEHFGDNVISWDVVNEAMNDNPPNPSDWKASLRQSGWYKAIGEDYVEQAFRAAKEVIDENGWDIKLYYNDYNDDNQNKAEAIYQMVKEINENYAADNDGDLLIDGIGMQGHYHLDTNPENVRRSLEKFISLGVEVGVTELDIRAGDNNELTEEQANAQGYLYAQLFKLYKEHADNISRVTFWGLNDASSWRAAQSPLLFDKDLQAKPAYYAVIDPDTFIAEHEPEEKEVNQGTASFGTPEIDGTIDDIWSDVTELPINRYQMAWQGADGVAKVLWDNENLYALIQVSDSELDKSSQNPWEQDSIEVFVDENNVKTSFYQDDDGQYRVNFDNETTFNPESIADGFESATHVSGNGYTVEVKIPFRSITPENNTQIGFDVQINDGQDGARQSAATWNDTTGNGYQDTSVFGVLTLEKSTDSKPEHKKTTADEEHQLPNTATNTFNYLLAGLILIIAGTIFFIMNRRRA
ncbi:endo-1,4-beta-xylanase [Aquibacillus albus]|uniref:Beta-xylanase n=1 Tax=Aquibacillus albus TaxID=1168171 RepID=A0ABS2N6A9_9BACI|nr:endo-1,4-beta-xylanase [Aquibacillus albus]